MYVRPASEGMLEFICAECYLHKIVILNKRKIFLDSRIKNKVIISYAFEDYVPSVLHRS